MGFSKRPSGTDRLNRHPWASAKNRNENRWSVQCGGRVRRMQTARRPQCLTITATECVSLQSLGAAIGFLRHEMRSPSRAQDRRRAQATANHHGTGRVPVEAAYRNIIELYRAVQLPRDTSAAEHGLALAAPPVPARELHHPFAALRLGAQAALPSVFGPTPFFFVRQTKHLLCHLPHFSVRAMLETRQCA
jgi:hypothetical protein